MSIRRLGICLSLVFLIVVLIGIPFRSQLSSAGTTQTPTVLAGRNVNMVSGTTLPGGDPWLQRQNEPTIAVSSRNPLHLLAGANDYRTVDMPQSEGALPGKTPVAAAPDAWLGVFTSSDGGESWTSTLLPGFPQEKNSTSPLHGYSTAADPVVRSGPNGIFYYSGIAFNRSTNVGVVFVARFIDNNNSESGSTIQYLDTKIIATGTASTFLDKPWIAIDQPRAPMTNVTVNGQSIPRHNVYIAYSAFSGTTVLLGDIMFARSNDCGTTWAKPIKISTGSYAHQGATIAIKPVLGEVLVAWRRFAQTGKTPDSIFVAQSFSRGLDFQSPVKVADIAPFDQPTATALPSLPETGTGYAFRINSYPTMTVDKSGHVYLAWSQRGVGPSGDARIMLSYSYLGTSWSSPQPVANLNEYGQAFLGHQIMPSFSFAAGNLILVWYDQRHDVSGSIYKANNWIIDNLWISGLTGSPYRHTMDVWAAEADTAAFPNLSWKSTQVSRYLYAAQKDDNGNLLRDSNNNPIIFPVQFNCVNYPLFKGGADPFDGDYIDVAASPSFRLDSWRNWIFNTDNSNPPEFHVAWTDNRDVRPPANGDWTKYTPASSTQDSSFISSYHAGCTGTDGNAPGMRNQNIYTSRITWGIEAGSPVNDKPLNLPNSVARAFVVYVKNNTGSLRSFMLAIAAQPAGGQASFLQFGLLASLNVDIAPYSTISRPVFIRSSNTTASVTININEINASGSIITGGLSSSVLINGDPTNPQVTETYETHNPNIVNPSTPNIVNWYPGNPNIVNPNIVNPNIVNPNIVNPNIVNPNIVNPNIVNPNIVNPNIVNPNIVNPNIVNPNIVNNTVTNPNIVNPNIVNPNIVNPNIVNVPPADVSATDVEWTVTNAGTATTSYTLQALAKNSPPDGVYTQLLVYRVHYTPAVAGAELSSTGIDACTLRQEPHQELVLNVVNPNIVNPNIVNPNIVNPNIVNSSIEDATFQVAPGEDIIVDLRVLNTGIPGSASQVQDFISSLGFAVTSQAVNSTDVANGVQIPPAAASMLVIGTGSLPDGIVGRSYGATLSAYGGTGPYSWSLNSGVLPPGLQLGPNGLIGGLPTASGLYHFVVRVDDATGHFETQPYSIYVNSSPTPSPLTIVTASPLPNGVQGQWYGATLEATGGVSPRTWSLVSGALPGGLTLNISSGVISGTPVVSGTFAFSVRVVDSKGNLATTGPLRLTVNALHLAFVQQPTNTEVGTVMTPPVIVAIRDQAGNLVTTATGTITLSFLNAGSATLSGTKSKAVSNGIATFDNLTINLAGSGYMLGASSGSLNQVDSSAFSITAPVPAIIFLETAADGSGAVIPTQNIRSGSSITVYAIARSAANTFIGNVAVDSWSLIKKTGGVVDGNLIPSGDKKSATFTGNLLGTGQIHVAKGSLTSIDSGVLTVVKAEEWVATYDGPISGNDQVAAMTVDSLGNTYVTGSSAGSGTGYDYATAKYNSAGARQWVTRYTGPVNSLYPQQAIAVDSWGNTYVTGSITSTRAIVTIKYDSSGVQQWVATYNGYANGAYGIAVDSSGDVYVVGMIKTAGDSSAYTTVKYDANGNQIWAATYGGKGGNSQPCGLAVDASGNVYVTGTITGSNTGNPDYATLKYDTNGNQIWVKTYDDSNKDVDIAHALAVDPSGNVYVTGVIYGDYGTVKYDTNGNELWVRTYNGPGNGWDTGQAITVDSSGNVYVTGSSSSTSASGSDTDYATVKYDANGNQLWAATYNGPGNGSDSGSAIHVDPLGNVYVSGTSVGSGSGQDYATIKYDSSGIMQWVFRYNGPGNGDDDALANGIDSLGSIYVSGYVQGSGTGTDYATLKYAQAFPSTLIITTSVLDNGYVGTPYAKALWAFGGSGSRTWSIVSGSGSLPPGMTLSPSTGIISGTPTTAGPYSFTVQVVDGSLTATEALSIIINPAILVPHQLAFSQQPNNTTAGVTISPAVTVQIQNAGGKLVTTATDTVTLSLINAGTATLGGTKSKAAIGGVATFNDLTVDLAGSGYVLRANSGSLTEVDSSPFSIGAPVAASILVETAADGSGTVVPAQNVSNGSSITVYAISRGAGGIFIGNVAADSWSVINKTGGVMGGDLIPAVDMKSATFTGYSAGTGQIHAVKSGSTSLDSGVLTVLTAAAPALEWTWASGSNTVNQAGSYGTKGTAASSNVPGARDAAMSWIDSSGKLWLFGGYGYDSAGTRDALNDLWKYDGSNWTWVSGSNTAGQAGSWGTKGIAASGNVPGPRNFSVSWIDFSGKLWLFGGGGYDSAGTSGWLNDLWKYDPTTLEWTWVSGSNTAWQAGVYGQKGTAASSNVPGARNAAASWIDSSGNLWLFGGNGCADNSSNLNDLWKYDGTNWTWVSGSNTVEQAGIYGTKGTADPSNVPGARVEAVSCVDSNGKLWLFGGVAFDVGGNNQRYFNDLWEYDPTTLEWTWVSGSNAVNQAGIYGTQGTASSSNVPGARGSAVFWFDSSGKLWLFGGFGYDLAGTSGYLNDLWKYDPATKEWNWVSGSNTVNQAGSYGTKGTAASSNVPGARSYFASWLDSSGRLWLFGGDGLDSAGIRDALNDLWQYSFALPDLVVSSLTHSPANPTTADTITFVATVQNIGNAAAGPSVLSFQVGGETTPPTYDVPSLAPRATYQVTRTAQLTVAQNYQNTATADVTNAVAESNETNNIKTDTYTVTPAFAAAFTWSPASPTAGQPVQFTDTSIGTPTSWQWAFGDGATSTSQNPSHTFSAAAPYTVTLTATNASGSSSISHSVSVVSALGAAFTWSPTSPTAGQAVQFTDTSTGTPTSWQWTFGDGATSTLQNPSHAFTIPQGYPVTLTVTNASGSSTAYHTVTVGQSLFAAFTYSPTSPTAGQAVQFTDTSTDLTTGPPTSWLWYFGDGATSTSRNPSHSFTIPQGYPVTLTVTNASGSSTAYHTVTVGQSLFAAFTYSPTSPTAGQAVQFTDTSTDLTTGPPTSWLWYFGDGATSTSQNPSHAYATPGGYPVTLTVTNASGSSSAYRSLTVATAALPDLVVASLTHSPANPTTADMMTFVATVQNIGNATAGPSVLSFQVGGETFPPTYNVPSLTPNATYQVTRTTQWTVAQTYQNTATADVTNVVTESNETNNVTIDVYRVMGAPFPDPIISGLWTATPYRPWPDPTDTIASIGSVMNAGAGSAGARARQLG